MYYEGFCLLMLNQYQIISYQDPLELYQHRSICFNFTFCGFSRAAHGGGGASRRARIYVYFASDYNQCLITGTM